MLSAAFAAARDVLSPALRAVLWKSLALTLALLAAVWFAADAGLTALLPVLGPGWDTAADWLTGVALVLGLGFLVAPVTALAAGLFLDDVADAVEREHYPGDPPGRPLAFWPGLLATLRFTALVVAVNAVLFVLVLLPGINLPVFVLANAYFVGREYFEFVASRHLAADAVRRERAAGSTRIFLAGVVVAAVMAIPLVNLMTPMFATAFFEHLFKRGAYRPA